MWELVIIYWHLFCRKKFKTKNVWKLWFGKRFVLSLKSPKTSICWKGRDFPFLKNKLICVKNNDYKHWNGFKLVIKQTIHLEKWVKSLSFNYKWFVKPLENCVLNKHLRIQNSNTYRKILKEEKCFQFLTNSLHPFVRNKSQIKR